MAFESSAYKLSEILKADCIAGNSLADIKCVGVTTDSRQVKPQTVFVARRGEAMDGHRFVEKALAAGAAACLVERSWAKNSDTEGAVALAAKVGSCLLATDDSTLALGQLASYWRKSLNLPTIAVTGSVGKSTTKEMAKSILLALLGQGTSNKKSYNNHVGLPETILEASRSDNWLLLEAGMNHSGELDYLTKIAQPDLAVVLNVGAVHLGQFNSIDEIADAKCEILNGLSNTGKALLRIDDRVLQAGVLRAEARLGRPILKQTFGPEREADFFVNYLGSLGSKGERLAITHRGETIETAIPHLGRHNTINACAATAMVLSVFPQLKLSDVVPMLKESSSAHMRLEQSTHGSLTIINDCYNANPLSMAAAIQVATNLAKGKSLALVLGDMLELGEASAKLHFELGQEVARSNCAQLFVVGNFADNLAAGAKENPNIAITKVNSKKEIVPALLDLNQLDYVLFKASRGIQLEEVVEELKSRLTAKER